jgi:hypothetical protein
MKRDAVGSAVQRLRKEIQTMPNGPPPTARTSSARQAWPQLGRLCLLNWADAIGRDLTLTTRGVNSARRCRQRENKLRHLEEALWRLDAAKEKMQALFAVAFHLPVLEPWVQGFRFSPDAKAFARKVRELSKSVSSAEMLADLWERVEAHPATRDRNYLSHSLPPLASVCELTFIENVYKRGGRIVDVRLVSLVPMMGAQTTWSADALLATAIDDASDCAGQLVEAAGLVGDVLAAAGRLEPPYTHVFEGSSADGSPRTWGTGSNASSSGTE